MRVRRALIAAALAVTVSASLTACQTKIGLAASVNNDRLTNSGLGEFLAPGAKPYTDSGATVIPKQFALEVWVRDHLIDGAITAKGGPRTAAESAAASAALFTGGTTIADVEKAYIGRGYTAKLADLLVDQEVALIVLIQRLSKGSTPAQALTILGGGQANTALLAAINAPKASVVVSTRYGVWDAQTLALSTDPTAGLPDFVQYGTSTPAATANPAG